MEIRKMPTEIKKNGFTYRQRWKGEKAVVFQQFSGDKSVGFEVFRLKVVKPHPKDADQSTKEAFPGNEDFGKWAWVEKDENQAFVRFLTMEKSGEAP